MTMLVNNMDEEQFKKLIDERILAHYKGGFTERKVTDTPTDAFALVPRKYVTNNGTVANRPVSAVAVVGQPYLATDTKIPMTYTSAGWVNGVGSVVAVNN